MAVGQLVPVTLAAMDPATLLGWVPNPISDLEVINNSQPESVDFQTKIGPLINAFLGARALLFAGGAQRIKNVSGGSLGPVPVAVTGYNAADDALTVVAADISVTNKFADGWLLSALANNAIGVMVPTGAYLTAAFNASGAAVGDPVYLNTAGALSLSVPAQLFKQVVGFVKVAANPGTISTCIRVPQLVAAANAANGVVQLTAAGKLPALDASLLTSVPGPANLSSGTGTLDGAGTLAIVPGGAPTAVVVSWGALVGGGELWYGTGVINSTLGAADAGSSVNWIAF